MLAFLENPVVPSVIAALKRRWAARCRSSAQPVSAVRYANQLIRSAPGRFDAIEIHGVQRFPDVADPTQFYCEIDSDNPEFFSVSLHCVTGGVTCCADLPTHRRALRYARAIARRNSWPVYDHGTTPSHGKN
ncbi:hypothetical protein [Burkholderia stagnalis]